MAELFAELVSPDQVVFAGEVRSVVLSGVEGDMTILPGHQPLVTMLHPGVVFAIDTAGTGRRAFVRGALAEVGPERVTILAERVLSIEELTGDQIDDEILQLQTQRDATRDETARARFDISIARLDEFKAGLGR